MEVVGRAAQLAQIPVHRRKRLQHPCETAVRRTPDVGCCRREDFPGADAMHGIITPMRRCIEDLVPLGAVPPIELGIIGSAEILYHPDVGLGSGPRPTAPDLTPRRQARNSDGLPSWLRLCRGLETGNAECGEICPKERIDFCFHVLVLVEDFEMRRRPARWRGWRWTFLFIGVCLKRSNLHRDQPLHLSMRRSG